MAQKIRILEKTFPNQEVKYFVQGKLWFFWITLLESYSFESAKSYAENYPIKEKIVYEREY
jgi:hypothetical protein